MANAYYGLSGYGIKDINDSSRYVIECKKTKQKIPKLIVINVDQKNTDSIANLFKMNEFIIDDASQNITKMVYMMKNKLSLKSIDVISFCVSINSIHDVFEKLKKTLSDDKFSYIMGIIVIVDKLIDYNTCFSTSDLMLMTSNLMGSINNGNDITISNNIPSIFPNVNYSPISAI